MNYITKNNLVYSLVLIFLLFVNFSFAQKNEKRIKANEFNENLAYEQAKAIGISKNELTGYIQTLKQEFYSQRALKKQTHIYTPYENNIPEQTRIIYPQPNKPLSIGCPNAGFEQYSFINWSGASGTYSGSASSPVYTMTNTIINSAGANTPLSNTSNFHTIVTQPASNPAYPDFIGYDSIAARSIGGQVVSEVPFKSPYSLDNVSCRMLGAFSNFKISRLKYSMSLSSNNKMFRYSYAVILHKAHIGDPTTHQPYFKVTVKDQNGNPIAGCNNYYIDATKASTDTSFKLSYLAIGGDLVLYKRWTLAAIDLTSPIYSSVTGVSIEFEVAGCSGGSHIGYAYVDAECGIGGIVREYCVGPNAILTAPAGYEKYQWYDYNNNPIAAPSGTNQSINVSAPVNGQVYSVNMVTVGGCTLTLRDTLRPTNVYITSINSAPSCGGGNSGSAYIQAGGSTGVYSYTWTSTSGPTNGQIVSSSATANNLPPGTYSVAVSAPGCGRAEANLSVGVTPPSFFTINKIFCGTTALLDQAGGTNYKWYKGYGSSAVLIPPPIGTNDSLFANDVTTGSVYTLVYINSQGCKDSIKYVLNQIAGGSAYVSHIKNVCPDNTDGSAVVHLNTNAAPNYTYIVTGPNSLSVITNTVTSALTVSLSSLNAGTYYVKVFDGECYYYDKTFEIKPIQTNFLPVSTNSMLCFPSQSATVNIQYFNGSSSCSTNTNVCSSGTETILFTTGTFTNNSAIKYPTPYGNFYTKERSQYLIRKSDLNTAGIFKGQLSSIAFKVINLNNSELFYENFRIKLGCTNKTALANATSSAQPFESGMTEVFYSPKQQLTNGWVTHTFPNSYYWDGVSNLLVEVCCEFPGISNFSENVSVELKQMPYIANMFYIEDTNPVCSGSQLADNGVSQFETPMTNGINMLPNMTFGYCPYDVSPINYTLSASSNGSITSNSTNTTVVIAPTFTSPPFPSTETIYTITAVNPNGGCKDSSTVAVTYPADHVVVTPSVTTNSVCENIPVTLSASGAFTYTWASVQGNTTTPISNMSSVSVIPTSIGTNTFIVIGASNCMNTIPDTNTVTVFVVEKANLVVSGLQDVTKCINKDYVLHTNVTSLTVGNTGEPYTYLWTVLPGNTSASGNNTSPDYTTTANTTTSFVVTVDGDCAHTAKDTVVITTFTNDLAIEITDSAFICQNTPFTLNTTFGGGRPDYTFSWYIYPNSNSISNSSNLSYNAPSDEGQHLITVSITDSCGYNKTDDQLITVLPPCNIMIPNIITPNGDGVNDFFKLGNLEHHPNISIIIYDRWGKKVYENANYNNQWKADGVSDGTFFYIIDVPDEKKYSGYVTVFRDK